jgi:hypothetical protein
LMNLCWRTTFAPLDPIQYKDALWQPIALSRLPCAQSL